MPFGRASATGAPANGVETTWLALKEFFPESIVAALLVLSQQSGFSTLPSGSCLLTADSRLRLPAECLPLSAYGLGHTAYRPRPSASRPPPPPAQPKGVHARVGLRCCRSEERRVGKECRSRWSPY